MVSIVLFRKLERDIRQRKWSLLALVAMVSVGVGVYASMDAVYLDLDGARQRYYSRNLMADFTVDLKRAPEWTLKVASGIPNVRQVRGRVKQSLLVDLDTRIQPIPGIAVSLPENREPIINGAMLRSGMWFSNNEAKEAILEHQFAEANNLEPGDRIKVLLVDKQHDLLVVGTAMSPEFVYLMPPGGGLSPDPAGYAVMWLPRKFLQTSGDLDGAYNELVGLANDTSRPALEYTLKLIKEALDPYGVTNTTPIQDQPSASVLRDELLNIRTTAAIFPVIFLGVAAMVLNILLGRMVAQQRSVIGTLRALGYSSWAITRHYLGYGIAVGLMGSAGGVALGWWLQGAMLDMYRQFFAMPGIDRHFHFNTVATGAAIAFICALVGAWKGSRKASKMDPAEAMHPPLPEQGGRVLPEEIPFFWHRLPFRWKMIFRAVFRNPFRSLVGIIGSAVATALIVASFSLYDATYFLMSYHFQRVAHQDLTVSLRNPKGIGALSEVGDLPEVSRKEPQLNVICDLRNGPYQKRTGVTGLPLHNTLYTPLDESGRKMVVPRHGMVLTRKLAEILNVRIGDHIDLRPLIARREETRAPVVGIVDTYLGLSAYCHIGYLSDLLGEYWVADSFLVSTFHGSSERSLMAQIRKRPAVIGITERLRAFHQMEETMGQFMGSFFLVTIIFAGIIALGSQINTALVSLSEREREVGTFRVLGYTSGQVTRIFSGESVLLNATGILIGIGLGIGVSHLLAMAFDTELYRFPAVILVSRLAFAVGLMACFLACAQLITYRMIRGLEWLDVLKVRE
jgi:putative ABC transport system permease protein